MENIVNPISNRASAGLDVTTLLATPSKSVKVEGNKNGVVAKVPALIGKTIVQIYIEALADLEEPALEITNIKHDLNLTSCEFMQVEDAKNGKLIVSGYIRENIDYTSAKVAEDGTVKVGSGRSGLNIPFKCFTKIQLDSEPELSSSNSLINPEDTANSKASRANNSYYSSTNEELTFDVAETNIRQVNVKRNIDSVSINEYSEQVFSSISINMAVDVALTILQNQYVQIPSAQSNSNGQGNNGKDGNNSSGKGGSSNNKNSSEGNKNAKNSDNGKNKENRKDGKKSSKSNWMRNFSYLGKMYG